MAAETHYEKGKMDISQHQQTFSLFWAMTKWGIIGNVVILALMALFLT